MGELQAEGHISLSKAQESEPGCYEDSEELIATSWRGGGVPFGLPLEPLREPWTATRGEEAGKPGASPS